MATLYAFELPEGALLVDGANKRYQCSGKEEVAVVAAQYGIERPRWLSTGYSVWCEGSMGGDFHGILRQDGTVDVVDSEDTWRERSITDVLRKSDEMGLEMEWEVDGYDWLYGALDGVEAED